MINLYAKQITYRCIKLSFKAITFFTKKYCEESNTSVYKLFKLLLRPELGGVSTLLLTTVLGSRVKSGIASVRGGH